jgi:transcriptional regulator with XRE-family HTH domain
VARHFSGQRLRDARIAAGLKPEQLAILIDRSVWSVHEYERGRAFPSVGVLAALSVALHCSVDRFFTEVVSNDAA